MKPHFLPVWCSVCFVFSAIGLYGTDPGQATVPDVGMPPLPRLTHPGAGQVFYFVLTDRFCNGDPSNDKGGYGGGPDDHGFDPTRVSHYHGGDFAGLTDRMDYLVNLGVSSVWVTPPFKNKAVQSGTAGYHGYWILDFLQIDPHLGSNDSFRGFVSKAHDHGLRVTMDIITNHTADVIGYKGGNYSYRSKADAPYVDCDGQEFSAKEHAWNGLGDPDAFPSLCVNRSFPHVPEVPAAEVEAKNPVWLNDLTLYHNRGNTSFTGENSLYGDFVGLDDLFTERPKVVNGFIDIYKWWIEEFGVDGFRIDTVKHVNAEFWQAFSPAIRAKALELGRPDFVQFGEVYSDAGDAMVLSEYSTGIPIDTTLDFGFFVAARNWVSKGGSSDDLAAFFQMDDAYTDHDSNVHVTTTFLGNHDAGRFAYFLGLDNPGAPRERLEALVKLGHGLMFLVRGQPVIYYGDEQGMIGRGGNDMQARESLFGSRAPAFRDAALLGTSRTGASDKYDMQHPFYRFFAELAKLRRGHAALATGAMVQREVDSPGMFAFSRIDRQEQVEYLVVLNNSRTESLSSKVDTSQRGGASFALLFDSRFPHDGADGMLAVDDQGRLSVTVEPMQFMVWKAQEALPVRSEELGVRMVGLDPDQPLEFSDYTSDGQTFVSRTGVAVELDGSDGFAEVTFGLIRESRPDQVEWLGTDDNAPYRVFWRPAFDLDAEERVAFLAVASDLRGRTAQSRSGWLRVAENDLKHGIRWARNPIIKCMNMVENVSGELPEFHLQVAVEGTGPFEYRWMHDGEWVPDSNASVLPLPGDASALGEWRVLVHNLSGSTLSAPLQLSVLPDTFRVMDSSQ